MESSNSGSADERVAEDRVTRPPEVVPSEDTLGVRGRLRRSRRRPPYMLMKIFLGGLVGLVLGQLLLWWLPRPFRRDPFGLAPRLPAAISCLAPNSLRPVPRTADAGDSSTSSGSGDAKDLSADETGELTNTSSLADLIDQAPAELEDPQRQVGLPGIPPLRMHTLESTFKYSQRSHEAFVARDDWSAAAVGAWYAALCALAHDVTLADVREPGISAFAEKTRALLVQVAEEPRRRRAIQRAARAWIDQVSNHGKGIVLVGNVRKISAREEMFRTDLDWQEHSVQVEHSVPMEHSVQVMSRVDPRSNARVTFAEGDHLLILGVVVTEPSLHLLGYRGDAEVVVWGGMPVRLGR